MLFRLSSAAQCDLQEISRYVGARNLSAAEGLLNQRYDKFAFLVDFPRTGPPRDDLIEGMRHSVVGSYVIFYRETEAGIEIMRVVHGSRDLNTLQFE